MLQTWELLSYIVTTLGLPLAIFIFVWEQRKQRENEVSEVNELLAASYTDFLKLVIANPDLKLRSPEATRGLDGEQQDRLQAIFEILISLFERAYLLAYSDQMSARQLRLWLPWEDFMREWCRREDFRDRLPELLPGEDPAFAAHIMKLAEEEVKLAAAPGHSSAETPAR